MHTDLIIGSDHGRPVVVDPWSGRRHVVPTDRTAGSKGQREARQKAEEMAEHFYTQLTLKLGRQPTRDEMLAGKCACPDSRTATDIARDAKWQPVRPNESTKSKALEYFEEAAAAEQLQKLSPRERQLRQVQDREAAAAGQKLDDERRATHQRVNSDKLTYYRELLSRENWNPASDETKRQRLRKLVALYSEPDASVAERTALERDLRAEKVSEIEAQQQRHAAKEKALAEQRAAAEAELAEYSELVKPAPVKATVPKGASRADRIKAFYASDAATDEAMDRLSAVNTDVASYDAILSEYVVEE